MFYMSPAPIRYQVNVTNTGSMDAEDAVLGMMKPPGAGENGVPLQQLYGFEKVLPPPSLARACVRLTLS